MSKEPIDLNAETSWVWMWCTERRRYVQTLAWYAVNQPYPFVRPPYQPTITILGGVV